MARVDVYVTPRSGKDEVVGWRGRELQVRVTSAPEAGRANAAVCALLADVLAVPKSRVSVVRGHSSRHKVLEVSGVTDAELARTLGEPDEPLF